MRGQDHQQSDIFSYLSPEQRVRQDHPLRAIRAMADLALASMTERFDAMYAKTGRPSIPPEKLLRAQLIQMLYSVRSERLLMEEIDYSVLYRWFVGMNLDEPVWDVTVFTKNRDRLLDGDVAREFLSEVVRQAQEKDLTSDEHFTVDGTLIEAWARRAFSARTRRMSHLTIPAIRRWTSTERSAATTRTNPQPIRTRCWRARVAARKPS
jgi:transposase